eukprot:3607386-Prymnesium_polylepis.1
MVTGSLKWRPSAAVTANLLTFQTFAPTASVLDEIMSWTTLDVPPADDPPAVPEPPSPLPTAVSNDAAVTPTWARCARFDCPCTASWNGQPN